MLHIAKLSNKKDPPVQPVTHNPRPRSIMIWREMENSYGRAWLHAQGPRIDPNGALSYVAKTWVMTLEQYSVKQIRMALVKLAEQYSKGPRVEVVTAPKFRGLVEQVSKR